MLVILAFTMTPGGKEREYSVPEKFCKKYVTACEDADSGKVRTGVQ